MSPKSRSSRPGSLGSASASPAAGAATTSSTMPSFASSLTSLTPLTALTPQLGTLAWPLASVPAAVPLLDPRRLSDLAQAAARELLRQGQSANTIASYQAAMRYWGAWFAARFGQEMPMPVPVPAVVQFIVDHAQREAVEALEAEDAAEEVDVEDVDADAEEMEIEGVQTARSAQVTQVTGDARVAPAKSCANPPANLQSRQPPSSSVSSVSSVSSRPALLHELPEAIDDWLIEQGFKGKPGALSLNTLVHRISVLSKAHQNLDLDNPCHHTQVRELLRSVRSSYAKRNVRPLKKAALTKEPLQLLLATCDASPRGVRDRALLLFAWASGGRRRSEVAGATLENLRQVGTTGYLYALGQSKTNQEGKIEKGKPVAGVAAQALAAWLGVLAQNGITEGAIFRRVLKNGRVMQGPEGLEARAVRKIVKARCALAGLSEDLYSAHSLRSGFVTEAGRRRMPAADAMAMTGHRNHETFMGYYQAEEALHSQASRLMDEEDGP